MKEYYEQAFEKKVLPKEKKEIQNQVVEQLNEEGYTAYNVTSENFEEIENLLNTDLSEIGLSPQYSYIITMDPSQAPTTRATVGSSYTYNYNGTNYTLRKFTVNSTDDPLMAQASSADLLESKSLSFVCTLLNSTLYFAADIASGPFHLGTIASICGIEPFNFGAASNETLMLQAGTFWVREYVQVWSSYDQKWLYGACTESAVCQTILSGFLLNLTTGGLEQINKSTFGIKSTSRFTDEAWKNQHAVIGYLNSYIQYDTTGNIRYKIGNKTIITHIERF